MSISIMPSIAERSERRGPLPARPQEDNCPDYDTAISRSNSGGTGRSVQFSSTIYNELNRATSPLNVSSRRQPRPPPRRERYIYTYKLAANSTPMHFMISVEPESGKPKPGKYTFRLSFKANGIERAICEPTTRTLRVNPRELDFVVFIFPGKSGVPNGSLWSVRIWLRVHSVDHRIFGDDELWVAKDPDFNAISDASFARLKTSVVGEQVYNAYVGRALIAFIVRWQHVSNDLYKYSLEYEADGVGDMLFENYKLRLSIDPRTITFLIYTIPSPSVPIGASHKLRVWLRSLVPLSTIDPAPSYAIPFNDSYIYQRIWKCDAFKIGARLDFESLGPKMVLAFSSGLPETIVVQNPAQNSSQNDEDLHNSHSDYKEKKGYDYS